MTRTETKYIHEGFYVAEVDVELLEDDTGWSPYLSVQDAYKSFPQRRKSRKINKMDTRFRGYDE